MPPHDGEQQTIADVLCRDAGATARRSRLPLHSLHSPIFWRIAAVVFLCIVIIEAVLLFFSWFSERERLLTRIDDSLAIIAPLLADSEGATELDRMLDGRFSANRHPLLGYVLIQSGGAEHANGNTAELGSFDPAHSEFNASKGYYDSYLQIPATPQSEKTGLWLRVDATQVSEELRTYVFRIIGLVLIISVFVTVGCLLALIPILIRPLQKLNQLMLIGQSQGLQHAIIPHQALQRADEIGNVYRSFKQLRTELLDSAEENNRITQRFQHFADLGADSFWEIDRQLTLTYAAGDIGGMFGTETKQLIGQPIKQCLSEMAKVIPEIHHAWSALKTHGFWEGVLENRNEKQSCRTIHVIASALRGDGGEFLGARGTVIDVTVASELAKELQHEASHDALTGLYNRREFDRILDHELTVYNDSGKPLIVCMLDLDRFKVVNDNCGHTAGDVLLKQLSELIRSTVRENDVVARFGGDEFTVLLRGCSIERGMRVAENVRKAVDNYRFIWKDEVFNVGASIGIAEAAPTLCDPESMILAVDACCIKAKSLGRNQVQAYNPSDESIAHQHGEMQWMARITQALEEDRMVLYHQLIVSLDEQPADEIHFEILLRLKDRDGSICSPGEFLPAAERYSLIDRIDRWVVNHVVIWLSQQVISADTQLCVNINLSAMTVSDTSFQRFLSSKIQENKVSANHLCFEITESAAMRDPAATVHFLHSLRALGCRIALDDFGTGFSSLGHIRNLPIDYIKIDGVFFKEIANCLVNQALVRSIAEVARILDVQTVAEYVENTETLDVLRQLNVDYAQGYFFAKPQPLINMPEVAVKKIAA